MIDLFTSRFGEKECKYSIYNDNRFIYLPAYKEGSINIQFTMIMNLLTSHLRKRECKYLIYNDNRFIYPLPRGGNVNI